MVNMPLITCVALQDGDKARDFVWGDPWHYAMSRIVVAARANGLRPVDGFLVQLQL